MFRTWQFLFFAFHLRCVVVCCYRCYLSLQKPNTIQSEKKKNFRIKFNIETQIVILSSFAQTNRSYNIQSFVPMPSTQFGIMWVDAVVLCMKIGLHRMIHLFFHLRHYEAVLFVHVSKKWSPVRKMFNVVHYKCSKENVVSAFHNSNGKLNETWRICRSVACVPFNCYNRFGHISFTWQIQAGKMDSNIITTPQFCRGASYNSSQAIR